MPDILEAYLVVERQPDKASRFIVMLGQEPIAWLSEEKFFEAYEKYRKDWMAKRRMPQ